MPNVPAIASTTSVEWTIPPVDGPAAPTKGSGSFGGLLSQQIGALQQTQDSAAAEASKVATGQATDPTQAVMAIERARLSMQLAAQIRNKAVESIQDVMRTQV